jgi:hypothetical protein
MCKSRSMELAQYFLKADTAVHNLFNLGRGLLSAEDYRYFRRRVFASLESAAAI